jgi:SpoVK/Ycf46/Vps4 family AAA+-type ATPase
MAPTPAEPLRENWESADPGHTLAVAAIERFVVLTDIPDDSAARDRADAALSGARAEFEAWLATPSVLAGLAVDAGLTMGEVELLAIAVAVERDERLQKLLIHVHADRERVRLEVGMLGGLLGPGEPGVLTAGPASGLRRAALVEVLASSTWSRQAISVAPSVMWALAGDPAPDPELPAAFRLVEHGSGNAEGASSVLVVGTDRARRRVTGMSVGGTARYLIGPCPGEERQWAAVVRDATLTGSGVLLDVEGTVPEAGRRWIDQAQHLVWVLASRRTIALDDLPDRPWCEVHSSEAGPSDDEWFEVLGTSDRRHILTFEQLGMVSKNLPVVGWDVDAAVRRLASSRLDELARRIRPSRSWDDLVLPPGHMRQLRELVDRYHLADQVYQEWGFPAVPSRGLVALFSGPSGTGKTLAAEVIAGELGLDLFKMDLSSVVSKYIGETEKNLDQLFEAAGAGNLVLFFDEADALFSRRSDVKDSHDRYANLETSYLLQRLETYDGVVIMATNFEKNIDQAFLRRIHTRVDFASPTEVERAAIWRQHLTHGAPVEGVDFDELARRFDITGGSIRNAAVYAAFLTAVEGGPITMERVVRGLGREYRKLGRLLKEADFGEYFAVVAADMRRE